MRYTVFRTPGAFDLRSIDTMGMNAKPNSDNPIGRFGTGLKNAIAILLREGASIDLYCNGDHYTFFTVGEEFRGSTFQRCAYKRENGLLRIFHNKIELPYTTELGAHWELWQAFRELYANTLDENGECFLAASTDVSGTDLKDITTIVIDSVEFAKIWEKRNQIFLDPLRETVVEVEGVGNITNNSSEHLYFRGMRAFDLPKDQPAMFTYNVIQEIELTEDRSIKSQYEAVQTIKELVLHSEDKQFIKAVLTAPEKSFEHQNLDFSWDHRSSKAFKEAITEIRDRPGVNRSVGIYYGKYVSPPEPKLIEDKQWQMILQALEDGRKLAYNNGPLNTVDDDMDIMSHYLDAMQRKFKR